MRLALFVVTLLVGCVGDIDTTGVDTPDNTGSGSGESAAAKAFYDQHVYPVMKGKCISCHNAAGAVGNLSGFVTTDAASGWTTITGFQSVVGNFTSSLAPVLGKIEGGHQGITYTATEKTKIVEWLDAEVAWRNAGAGSGSGSGSGTSTETPAQATQRVLAEWSACMTKTNFDAADMADAWGNLTADNNQRCSNCHASGDGGFMASVDSQLFFDVVSQNKYYLLQYFTVKLDLANLQASQMQYAVVQRRLAGTGPAPAASAVQRDDEQRHDRTADVLHDHADCGAKRRLRADEAHELADSALCSTTNG
jgi:hypothetical protein